MPCIEARGLRKAYGATIALDGATGQPSADAAPSKPAKADPPEEKS